MHCQCCDKLLTESEATAKFVEKDGSKPHRFVEMCNECLSFMPPDIQVVRRRDASTKIDHEAELYDPFQLDDGDGDVWDDL